MAMAIFPYLPAGLRLENITLPLVVMMLVISSLHNQLRFNGVFLKNILPLLMGLFAVLIGSLVSDLTGAVASPVVMFIRLCMPILMLISFSFAICRISHPLESAAIAIVTAAVPAALASIVSAFTDISWLISLWVRNDEEGVWAQSLAIGRFNGIFNQPLEAGIFFSVALFASIYILKVRSDMQKFTLIAFIFIMIGGVLSLSKNFTVLGLAMGLYFAVSIRLLTISRALVLSLVGFVIVFFALTFNAAYVGSFIDLFNEGGFLLALTAGRLGAADTDVSLLFIELWSQGFWLFGRGLGAHLPLDNGYLEYFYQGGIFSLLGYVIFLITLCFNGARNISRSHGVLMNTLIFFIFLASLGGPVITANRANIALILLIVACATKTQPPPAAT